MSVQPSCCQLYVPKSPALAATLAQVREAEASLDQGTLVQAAVAGTEEERFEFPIGAVAASETT